jgi:hypothetical protein
MENTIRSKIILDTQPIPYLAILQKVLEHLDWYGNIQNSIHLADRTPLASNPATTEDGHLESDYEDRVSGTGG